MIVTQRPLKGWRIPEYQEPRCLNAIRAAMKCFEQELVARAARGELTENEILLFRRGRSFDAVWALLKNLPAFTVFGGKEEGEEDWSYRQYLVLIISLVMLSGAVQVDGNGPGFMRLPSRITMMMFHMLKRWRKLFGWEVFLRFEPRSAGAPIPSPKEPPHPYCHSGYQVYPNPYLPIRCDTLLLLGRPMCVATLRGGTGTFEEAWQTVMNLKQASPLPGETSSPFDYVRPEFFMVNDGAGVFDTWLPAHRAQISGTPDRIARKTAEFDRVWKPSLLSVATDPHKAALATFEGFEVAYERHYGLRPSAVFAADNPGRSIFDVAKQLADVADRRMRVVDKKMRKFQGRATAT